MELTLAQAELEQDFPEVVIETFSADLGVAGSAVRLYEAVSRRRPRIDVLVNESWTGESDMIGARSVSSQVRAIRVNIEALTVLTQCVAGDMVANGGGRILTMGLLPGSTTGMTDIYPATSAFVETFSRNLGRQLDGTGVTVTHLRAFSSDHMSNVADLALDGMMRGDGLVALDGSHRTPVSVSRVLSGGADGRSLATAS
jgi:short-subunit dehydrogenase